MNDKEIYDMLPVMGEFNSADVNKLLDDKMVMVSEHDTIPYKTKWVWSINTEEILSRLRDKGLLLRSTGVHCNWYIKGIKKYEDAN